MVKKRQEAKVDPRSVDNIYKVDMKKIPREDAALTDDPTASYMTLLSMLLGIFAILFRYKAIAYTSIFCSMVSFANTKAQDFEFKQVLSSVSIAIMGLFICYRKEFSGSL